MIFRDDEDRVWFLARLAQVAADFGWLVHAYCLMGNHFHLVVETPEPTLGAGMHQLKGPYARRFNRIYGGSGHVFEDRFWNGWLRSESRYEWTLGYVAQNPVRAQLCEDPEDWPWSSFARVVRGEPAPVNVGRLLDHFAWRAPDPLSAYIASVRGMREPQNLLLVA